MVNAASSTPQARPTSAYPAPKRTGGFGMTPPVAASVVKEDPNISVASSSKKSSLHFDMGKMKKIPMMYIVGVLLFLLLAIGGGVAFFLSQQQQDIRQQASTGYICAGDQVEVNGVCVNSDTGAIAPGSGDCPLGQIVVNGTCMQASVMQNVGGEVCGANQVSVNGVCVSNTSGAPDGTKTSNPSLCLSGATYVGEVLGQPQYLCGGGSGSSTGGTGTATAGTFNYCESRGQVSCSCGRCADSTGQCTSVCGNTTGAPDGTKTNNPSLCLTSATYIGEVLGQAQYLCGGTGTSSISTESVSSSTGTKKDCGDVGQDPQGAPGNVCCPGLSVNPITAKCEAPAPKSPTSGGGSRLADASGTSLGSLLTASTQTTGGTTTTSTTGSTAGTSGTGSSTTSSGGTTGTTTTTTTPTPTPSPGTVIIPVAQCGTTTCPNGTDAECAAGGATGLSCQTTTKRCILTQCVAPDTTKVICSTDKCSVTVPSSPSPAGPQCRSTCSTNTDCPTGHTCQQDGTGKVCINATCLVTNIVCDSNKCTVTGTTGNATTTASTTSGSTANSTSSESSSSTTAQGSSVKTQGEIPVSGSVENTIGLIMIGIVFLTGGGWLTIRRKAE